MGASLAAGSRSAWQHVGTSAFAPGSVIRPCTHAPRPSLPSASAVHCLARTNRALHFAHVRSTQIPKSGKLDAKVCGPTYRTHSILHAVGSFATLIRSRVC